MVRVLCNQASITFIKNFHDFALRIVVDHVDFFGARTATSVLEFHLTPAVRA